MHEGRQPPARLGLGALPQGGIIGIRGAHGPGQRHAQLPVKGVQPLDVQPAHSNLFSMNDSNRIVLQRHNNTEDQQPKGQGQQRTGGAGQDK